MDVADIGAVAAAVLVNPAQWANPDTQAIATLNVVAEYGTHTTDACTHALEPLSGPFDTGTGLKPLLHKYTPSYDDRCILP